MKIKNLLIYLSTLLLLNLNAEKYVMEIPKKTYEDRIQIKEVEDVEKIEIICKSPDFLSLDGKECISYNWSHTWNGYGTRNNNNNNTTILKAIDGDIETSTEFFSAAHSNSRVYSIFTPNNVIKNKRITIHWQDYITGGYGNRAHYQIFYKNQSNADVKILNDSSYYSDSNWTDRSVTFDVSFASSIYLWARDIGKGSPRFKWKEIVIENIPNS
tara:strand:- start:3785 stop:4426 length:642 start_codon:yes stop_codon:yes gene_type:complete